MVNSEFSLLPITGVAKTITDVMGINAPEKANPSIDIVCDMANEYFRNQKADRVFMYNPDAIALWLFEKYITLFEDVISISDIQMPMLSIMPSVTPVCFASMYTGATPDVHGIKIYVKPVVRTDSVFDALIRANKKPVIVSTLNDSMSCIFQERDMDYFVCDTPDECNEKAMELIAEDKHDLIVLYNGNYDVAMHRYGTEAAESLKELKNNIKTYCKMINQIEKYWSSHRTMIGFCPDHGCHDIKGNLGSHGLEMPEDMNIIHFYKFI